MNTKSKTLMVLFAGLLCIGSLLTFYFLNSTKDFNQPARTFDELGGDFTLESYRGDVSLSEFKGKFGIMYFGYMSCAEVCPNSLMVMSFAMQKLEEAGIDNTYGLFVSVDPLRDTSDKMKEFTDYFHPRIIGLTGDADAVRKVSAQYGVYYDESDLSDSFMEYSVSHASRFYIVNANGDLVKTMSHTTTSNELAAQIKEIM